MKNIIFLILPLFFACSFGEDEKSSDNNFLGMNTGNNQEVTTYYFIRHAEKDTSDPSDKNPELTDEGVKRAEKWAEVFKDIPFDLIYSSKYKRTRHTAQPIADSQQLDVQLYDSSKLNDEDFQQKTKGKTVLVVGHTNTNPQWVNYILEEKKYKDIDESESGSLFIVTVLPDGRKSSKVLYIN